MSAAVAGALRQDGLGIPSHEQRLLLAHVLQLPVSRLALVSEVNQGQRRQFAELAERRRAGVPLQHLLGKATFRNIEVTVGPGVFIPRPETEVMTGWAIAALTQQVRPGHRPRVIDLGTGSGAIAKAIANEVPHVEIYAVESSPQAHEFAAQNLADTEVELRLGDLAEACADLTGTAAVVISNPPYIPLTAWESVPPEVRDFDPPEALFSGVDGLDAFREVVAAAGRLLLAGGLVAIEHAEVQGEAAVAELVSSGQFDQVTDRKDLTGRSRFTTGRRLDSGRMSG